MPRTTKHPSGQTLSLNDRVLVIVGANGSGKTRLGAWLEKQNIGLHYRVSAHRALNFPENIQPADLQDAERKLRTGNANNDNPSHNWEHYRWKSNPATALLDDFAPLLEWMISESFTVSDKYRTTMQKTSNYVAPPQTRLDVVKTKQVSVPTNDIRQP